MADKFQYVEELADITLRELSDKDKWISYLASASHHYKYSFHESCLIFAQNEDATAVASFEQWNNKMNRYINKGTSGIALIDGSTNNKKLKYVFDISDTNGKNMPFIWQLKKEYNERVNADLADSFEIEIQHAELLSTVSEIVDSLVEENIDELLNEFNNNTENAAFDSLDESTKEKVLREVLTESVLVTVYNRCGYEDKIKDIEISQLHFFNTHESIVQLGVTTSDISKSILMEIEASVKSIDKEIRNERRHNSNGIQTSERNNDTSITVERTDSGAVGEIRSNKQETSTGQPQREVSGDVAERDPVSSLSGSGEGSHQADGQTGDRDETEHSTGAMDTEDNRDRESTDKGFNLSEINDQDDIDTVLLQGSGFQGGKQRIIDYYFEEKNNAERTKFLKDEYGIAGGGSVTFKSGIQGSQDHDKSGIKINNRGYGEDPIKLTWSKIAKRIGELIDSGRYYEQRYANEKPLIKPHIDETVVDQGADDAPFSFEEYFEENINTVMQDFAMRSGIRIYPR